MIGSPTIRVSILPEKDAASGRPAPGLDDRVLSFSYEDSDKGVDRCTLTLRNDDLFFFEQEYGILGGALIEVSWGYVDEMSPPRRLTTKKIKGGRILSVEAVGVGILMHQKERSRSWVGWKRSDIVRRVAAEHGYEGVFADIEETPESVDTNQAGETDAAFLRRIASREGFELWIDDLGLHWKRKPFSAAPEHVFVYQRAETNAQGIIEWSVESDLKPRIGGVTVQGRDPIEKKDIKKEATADTTTWRFTLGDIIKVVHPDSGVWHLDRLRSTGAVRSTTKKTDAAAQREADARFVKAERETVKLSLTVLGRPSLRAKTLIEVRGLSTMIDGLYYVSKCTHDVGGSGYTCRVECVRDALGKMAAEANAKPQTGKKNDEKVKKEPEIVRQVEGLDGKPPRFRYHHNYKKFDDGDPEVRAALLKRDDK